MVKCLFYVIFRCFYEKQLLSIVSNASHVFVMFLCEAKDRSTVPKTNFPSGTIKFTLLSTAEDDDDDKKEDSIIRRGKGFDMSSIPNLSLQGRQTFENDKPKHLKCSMIGLLLFVCTNATAFYQSRALHLLNIMPAIHYDSEFP